MPTEETESLRKILADVVLNAVLHPDLPGIETVPRPILDQARMVLDAEDLEAAAIRSRENVERKQ